MRTRIDDERGMVTAETAVVLPVLLLVLAAAVGAVTVLGAQLRCVDAAREAARAAARGEAAGVVSQVAADGAPDGAVTAVALGPDDVRVTVAADVGLLGPVPLRIRVAAQAVAQREPGTAGAG